MRSLVPILILALVTACDAAASDPAAPAADALGTDTIAAADVAATPGCESLAVGDVFLFDTLTIDRPAAESVQQLLNDLWAKDIRDGELVILYRIDALDRDTGTLRLSVGNGARSQAGTFDFSQPPQETVADLDGCAFASRTAGRLVMQPSMVNKPIPFEEFMTSGTFVDGGARVVDGRLDGGFTTSAMEGLTFELELLGETELLPIFEVAGITPDRDLDSDGTPDAYVLAGGYAARRLLASELP